MKQTVLLLKTLLLSTSQRNIYKYTADRKKKSKIVGGTIGTETRRGVWTYKNTWYWSAAQGEANGRVIGFNLGYGFGDTKAASENMLFCDGTAHKLGRIDFGIPKKPDGSDDLLSAWHFADEEGRVDLVFTPILDRASKTDVLVICSDQHQVFGHFTGTVRLDDGSEIQLDHFLGFAEKVFNKW